jgi:hypothetical protein
VGKRNWKLRLWQILSGNTTKFWTAAEFWFGQMSELGNNDRVRRNDDG